MEDLRGDGGESWRLPEPARPPLLGELVERIDEALATARASEAAVMTVGAAALDAAEQARRAAELAERASAAVAGVARPLESATPSPAGAVWRPATGTAPGAGVRSAPEPEDDGMRDFTARADRISKRLHKLQLLPLVPISEPGTRTFTGAP